MIATALTLLALAADPVAKPGNIKAMLQDATDVDGGAPRVGPDVSKMPFTPDSIKTVMKAYAPQIQSCYEETLAEKEKAVEGTLKTIFTITGEGYVKGAKIDKKGSSLKEPRLHDCVVAVLQGINFPKPPDAKDHPIEYPFNLKAIH